jgi:catalase (peroxidase I)
MKKLKALEQHWNAIKQISTELSPQKKKSNRRNIRGFLTDDEELINDPRYSSIKKHKKINLLNMHLESSKEPTKN